ncbi:MAG: LysR family transcriptional regulator [Gammaproteobacteria bacterium]|nr:LysR family transcriptional regulator [Gammaproteobacteria bacterium]
MSLDMKSLRQVMALATHRNFSRAAAALHVSQPALSRSLMTLEQNLGVRLFDRSRRGVTPTSFGQVLIDRGGRLMASLDDIRGELDRMRGLESGSLTVGAGLYPAEMSVGTAIGRLTSRHPGLRISLRAAPWRDIVESIVAQEIEIAVVDVSALPANSPLGIDRLPCHEALFVCRPGHPLLRESLLSVAKIFSYPFVGPTLPPRISAPLGSVADRFGCDPSTGDLVPPLHVESIALARHIVTSCDAIAALPRVLMAGDLAAGKLAALPWRPAWLHTNYGFVYRRDRDLSPVARAFVAEVSEIETALAAAPAASRGLRPRGSGVPVRRKARQQAGVPR